MIIKPTWRDLITVIEAATDNLLICTPFYSDDGIFSIFDNLENCRSIDIVTRLSPSDWYSGVSNPESLNLLLQIYAEDGIRAKLFIHQRLHAKAYIANRTYGLMGSSNLSSGGFDRNFELMLKMNEDQACNVYKMIIDEVSINARQVDIHQLHEWIENSREIIQRARKYDNEHELDLANAQKSLDKLLKYGGEERIKSEISVDHMKNFVDWLTANQDLFGSDVLLEHHENLHGFNRTGHFRQCFFIVSFFYEDNPDLCKRQSNDLDVINSTNWSRYEDSFINKWIEHLASHAIHEGESYSYPTMRSILPSSLGGTVSNGGGASGTLKRMFRLLARFMDK